MRWDRIVLTLSLALGCASSGPAPVALNAPNAQHAESPAAAAQATDTTLTPSSPVAESPRSKPTPAPPDFEPLELSDEQLNRARRAQRHVAAAAEQYSVDPNLINGIIWAESKFNPKARNRSGARGLMQLMPRTSRAMAKRIGRPNRPYDPQFAVMAGTHLLSGLLDKFDDDEELALFGYARGSGSVRGWQERGETEIPQGVQKFIARVRRAQVTFANMGFPDAAP